MKNMFYQAQCIFTILLLILPKISFSSDAEVLDLRKEYSCSGLWNKMPDPVKVYFLVAYQIGYQGAVGLLEHLEDTREEGMEATLHTLKRMGWPKGHRVGSMLIELDVFCKDPAHATTYLGEAIMVISGTKNATDEELKLFNGNP